MSTNSGFDLASTSHGSNAAPSTSSAVHGSSKYRAYAAAVDKALKSFENTTDWADLISALGKLWKCLQQSSRNFSDVPKSVTVAKRLSQCMHPALPGGVHMKALETYKEVFAILKRDERVSKELYLYAIGLFPLMDHCGIIVKKELLTIFESYVLPLGDQLKPALPGFIATVLLGLEEGTEFFHRAELLLNNLLDRVGNEAFYSCLWEAVLHSPPVRLPALVFINSKFDKSRPIGEQFAMFAGVDHADHMIAALCAVAEDSSGPSLMHRNLLDFLCAAFPLNSDHVTQADFVQLLRRCLFIVLRRDMSLTRRVYQWILNKSSDQSTAMMPASGKEDERDIEFFDTYSLPLIKLSIVEFLKLDTVEVQSLNTVIGTVGGSYDGIKEHQTHFTEVRLCRALQYFLDRQYFGLKILEEVLAIFLEYCCIHDTELIAELQRNCEQLDASFSPDWAERVDFASDISAEKEVLREKRLEELRKTFNSLLNNLETDFLWNYLSNLFVRLMETRYKNESDDDDPDLTNEERQKRDFQEAKRKEHIVLFPVMVEFCLKVTQLDSHLDIRAVCLPNLLHTILSSISTYGCDAFSRDNLVALLAMCKRLLREMNQSVSSASENGEQKMVEKCLVACQELVANVCRWYTSGRDRDKTGVLVGASACLRDFADFPFYSFEVNEASVFTGRQTQLPLWLGELIKVVDVASWQASCVMDFDVRSRVVDLIIYLYIRSNCLIDQHTAVVGREMTFDYSRMTSSPKFTKSTTTVLLKPMLTKADCNLLNSSEIFQSVGKVLWRTLSIATEASDHQTATCLLHRLHSRNVMDPSSDVEATILADLTAMDKAKSSEACRRFRKLWTLTRASVHEDVYSGIPYKPFNKVIMVLLGTVADDSLDGRSSSLKTLATAWFIDCAKHGDLPRVLQMLATILLNPATARVSIQYMQIHSRITRDLLKSMPSDVNALSLVAANGPQCFQHVCRDVASPNKDTVVDCTTNSAWISDLKKYLLAPPSTDTYTNGVASSTTPVAPTPAKVNTHKRTVSDIPQFDEDTESLGDLSIDSSIDPDVIDCVAFLIESVCDEFESSEEGTETSVELPENKYTLQVSNANKKDRRSLPASFPSQVPRDKAKDEQSRSMVMETMSIVPSPPPVKFADNIKRIKTGHRRQDSLQESIFSTPTQELRLFDPSELPKLTAPGDDKQPLLEETQAHMLLYMESPNMVDLGRAETIFRILSSLLRSNRGAALGRMMVHCMVFNQTSTLPQSMSGGVCQLVEYLNRHYKAIQGFGFWHSNDASSQGQNETSKARHCSFFELFCTVSLYYLRSYFLNSPVSPVNTADLTMAWECKIAALDFFTDLLRELISLITETKSREFVNFILTIYRQTKLQRCLISFLLTAVPNQRAPNEVLSVSADIAEFNSGRDRSKDFSDLAFAYHRALLDFSAIVISLEYHMNVGLHYYSDQNLSLNVDKSFVVHKLNYNTTQNRSTLRDPRVLVVELKLFISVIVNALQRLPERHELWLQFLINVLPFLEKALPTITIHVVDQLCRNIDTCVSYAYGHVGATTFDTGSVADEALSIASSSKRKRISCAMPPESYSENYALIVIEALTTIMHYCMLETPVTSGSRGGVVSSSTITAASNVVPSNVSPTHSVNSVGGTSIASTTVSSGGGGGVVSMVNMIPGTKGATEMLGNLFNKVFTSSDSQSNIGSVVNKYDQRNAADIWKQARDELLKNLPHFLSTICDIWAVAIKNATPRLPIGTADQLKTRVFDLINPLAKRHPNALLIALSNVWMTRASRTIKTEVDQPYFSYSDDQLAIANLLLSLKVLPLQHAIFAIAESLKDIARGSSGKAGSTTSTTQLSTERLIQSEVALLEMLHGCIRLVPSKDLHDCWSALNILFSDAPLAYMCPRAVFLEFKILDDFVRICGSQVIVEDKQISRAVQDACQRLTDAVNTIVGWQLETTTWLKRTLVVRQDTGSAKSGESTPMMETKSLVSSLAADPTNASVRGSTTSLVNRDSRYPSHFDVASGTSSSQLTLTSTNDRKSSSNLRASIKDSAIAKKDPANSTQALFLLADCLAELIDSVCKSEDKEKLIPTLQAVWANTLPYLKAKSARNARFFLASSRFLASISSFSYMRPVWRKATLELLFESSFFKMDIHSLKQWMPVIDNLMTNDKTSFKELLARIPSGPNSTLSSLITNKEQEYEMRAQALKRLAFVVLSSQMHQYSQQLPDIQERLSDNLRLSQVPLVHAQVFACYRVLLIRMQPFVFVSIWPTMATELVQVLLQIENQLQQLATSNDSTSISSSTTTSANDELKCSRDDQWMQLYLAACKLLEALCTLPSGYVSQFQTCHWAFISSLASNSNKDSFVPFATRIHQLLSAKYGVLTPDDQGLHSASLQNIKNLSSFSELRPFFHALASQHSTVVAGLVGGGFQECLLHDASTINGTMTLKAAVSRLEHGLYVDFAEHMQL